MRTVQERLIAILRTQTQDRGRFRWLAEHSELSEANWKSCYYARQRPNPEMLEWVCREWPQFTMWLMTGALYPAVGQIRPVLDEYRGVMQQELWSAKRMKAAIALTDYCRANGLDEERIDSSKVPRQLLDAMARANKMATDEIRAFLDRPELVWETDPYEQRDNYAIDAEYGSKVDDLPEGLTKPKKAKNGDQEK